MNVSKALKLVSVPFIILKDNFKKSNDILALEICLNYACNGSCTYCEHHKLKTRDSLSHDQIMDFLKTKAKNVCYINLIGGEPLLHKDIGKIINSIQKTPGIFLTMFSNGILVSKRIKELKKLDALILSLDGSEKNNDKIRFKGNHQHVIRAIKSAKKEGITTWLAMVISKYNLEDLDYVVNLCIEYNLGLYFDCISEQPFDNNIVKKNLPDKKKFLNMVKHAIKLKKEGAPILNTYKYMDYLLTYPKRKRNFKCTAGKYHFRLEPNGNLFPCYYKINKETSQNIFNNNFNLNKINPQKGCEGCWGCEYIELNYWTRFNISPLIELIRLVYKTKIK